MSAPANPTAAQAFAQRLHQAMQEAGFEPKPSILLKHFNERHEGDAIAWQTARNWLQGAFLPQPDKLRTLAQWLQVHPEYLLYGSHSSTARLPENCSDDISASDQTMWQHYLESNTEVRMAIKTMAQYCAQAQLLEQENQALRQQVQQLTQTCEQLEAQLLAKTLLHQLEAVEETDPSSPPETKRL